MIKLLLTIFFSFQNQLDESLVRYDLYLLLQGFNRFSKFLIQNRICIVIGFCCWFNCFCFLRALTSLTSLASFVSEVGASTSLLDTETALATGLVSGAFQLLLLDLQVLQFWLCFCICTTCFFSCLCFAI